MDIKAYIGSGVLEEYCLGLLNDEDQAFLIQMCMLYPEVLNELRDIENTLENVAKFAAIEPSADVKQKILAAIDNPTHDAKIDLDHLPLIDRHADHKNWYQTIEHLIPAIVDEDFFCRVLRNDEKITQMLVITKTDVLPETHDDMLESFLILKGACKCTIGYQTNQFGPGGFIDIPLNVEHDVKILSPYVIAILQYQAV